MEMSVLKTVIMMRLIRTRSNINHNQLSMSSGCSTKTSAAVFLHGCPRSDTEEKILLTNKFYDIFRHRLIIEYIAMGRPSVVTSVEYKRGKSVHQKSCQTECQLSTSQAAHENDKRLATILIHMNYNKAAYSLKIRSTLLIST